MKYKLLIIGSFTKQKCNTSCEFFSNEFANRFEKLDHVEVIRHHFDNEDFPKADIALVHAYASTPGANNCKKLKTRVSKAVYFMEEAINLGFDYYYYYGCNPCKMPGKYIKAPVSKKLLNYEDKIPNSVLLDHDVSLFPCYNSPIYDWNNFFWEYFTRNKNKFGRIAQLGRGPVERPDFIEVIPVADSESYLKATVNFETFICTHAGSYNHTALDMALRGTRVVAPYSTLSFVPQCTVNDFNMYTMKNSQDLDAIFSKPFINNDQIYKATDLDEIVQIMDKDFVDWLPVVPKNYMFI